MKACLFLAATRVRGVARAQFENLCAFQLRRSSAIPWRVWMNRDFCSVSIAVRLRRFEYAAKADRQQILSFYMGKNIPERKDYIMENLIVPVED